MAIVCKTIRHQVLSMNTAVVQLWTSHACVPACWVIPQQGTCLYWTAELRTPSRLVVHLAADKDMSDNDVIDAVLEQVGGCFAMQ